MTLLVTFTCSGACTDRRSGTFQKAKCFLHFALVRMIDKLAEPVAVLRTSCLSSSTGHGTSWQHCQQTNSIELIGQAARSSIQGQAYQYNVT